MKNAKRWIGVWGVMMNMAVALPVFSEADVQQPIVLKSSDTEFVLRLTVNRTTGYDWFLVTDQQSAPFHPVSSQYIPLQSVEGHVGRGGYREWHFTRNDQAPFVSYTAKLNFIYARAWETAEKPLTIVVRVVAD